MYRTAESVSPKHPDKMCDQISDGILDACLKQDKNTRSAIEVMGGHGIVTITGELTTNAYVEPREIVKRIVGEEVGIQVNIVQQSSEIAQGVDMGGAGDQGVMVGYATAETENFMPLEYELARRLCEYLYNIFPADGKTQVTIKDGVLETIVTSWCGVHHEILDDNIEMCLKTDALFQNVMQRPVIFHINPAGDWNIGGFHADTGLTGRKLAIDNYGPRIPLGGGAFSGKDATKVDRSGAYMARKIAVDLLKEKGAQEVMVQIAYAIGFPHPVSATAWVDGRAEDLDIQADYLTPRGIIETLHLTSPQFEQTAKFGHFGRNFIWN